jgi:hypothetical protein
MKRILVFLFMAVLWQAVEVRCSGENCSRISSVNVAFLPLYVAIEKDFQGRGLDIVLLCSIRVPQSAIAYRRRCSGNCVVGSRTRTRAGEAE